MSTSTSALVEVDGLQVEFHTKAGWARAVKDVSFQLYPGRTMAVLGESGSGKTSVARAMLGVLPAEQSRIVGGQIRVEGQNILDLTEARRRSFRGPKLAMIFQDALSALNPVLPVGFQIAEGCRVHLRMSRREAAHRAVELLQLVGIPDAENRAGDYPHQFSGGMRQRVMIAISLAADPLVLVADEPTTALDVTIQAQILQLLKQLKQERQMSLLLITHDMGVVAQVADDITVMYAGRVVEQGDANDVFRRPSHPYTQALLDAIIRPEHKGGELPAIKGTPPDIVDLPKGCSFRLRCPHAEQVCHERPNLIDVEKGHVSACHFAKDLVSAHDGPGKDGQGSG